MPVQGLPWSRSGDTVFLRARVTPKAACDRVDGIRQLADGVCVLAVRVRAVPENGAANKALVRLVARALDLPQSSVAVSRGATARVKTLAIVNAPADVLDRLASLVE